MSRRIQVAVGVAAIERRRSTLRGFRILTLDLPNDRDLLAVIGVGAIAMEQRPADWIFGRAKRLSCRAGILWVMLALLASALQFGASAVAQTPPSPAEYAAYAGLHHAAANGNVTEIRSLLAERANPNHRDLAGRTPMHVAAFGAGYDAVRALVAGGGDINALENDRYDVITIAAVKDDISMVKLAIELGGNPKAITSRYDGTALIAAAHLGHSEVVSELIVAGASLDHVNNLGWTALMEAVVLGDGGARHVAIVQALVEAGAKKAIADRGGVTPLQHAQRRGYQEMTAILQ